MQRVCHRTDHALPVAAVNIWYRVGAKEEPPGRSGFAHLFEHLMFMGTKRVPGNDFDNLMEAGGGSKVSPVKKKAKKKAATKKKVTKKKARKKDVTG